MTFVADVRIFGQAEHGVNSVCVDEMNKCNIVHYLFVEQSKNPPTDQSDNAPEAGLFA